MSPIPVTRSRWAALWTLAVLVLFAAGAPAAPPDEGPRLGVAVQNIPSPRLDALGLSHGVSVRSVVPGTPAAEAGILPGDILVDLDGDAIYSAERLQWLVSQRKGGEPATIRLRRGDQGQEMEIQVIPRAVAPPHLTPGPLGTQPPAGGQAWLGIRMQPMTNALRERYGVPEGRGVLVVEVEAESPAAEAKLQAGDVLTRIDRRPIRSPFDVYRAINFFDPGETVELEVMRDKENLTLQATLAGKGTAGGLPFWHPFGHPPSPRPGFWMEEPPESWPETLQELMELWRMHPGEPPAEAPGKAPAAGGAPVPL